jgi:hypothetical protein
LLTPPWVIVSWKPLRKPSPFAFCDSFSTTNWIVPSAFENSCSMRHVWKLASAFDANNSTPATAAMSLAVRTQPDITHLRPLFCTCSTRRIARPSSVRPTL